ncbi:Protein obstructor-E [Nymphon striatum]|nr:Protein obstructor-E [Nymphon striatum]
MENGCLVPDWFDGPVIPADLFHDKEDTDVDTGDQQAVDDAEYDDGSSTDSEWSDDSKFKDIKSGERGGQGRANEFLNCSKFFDSSSGSTNQRGVPFSRRWIKRYSIGSNTVIESLCSLAQRRRVEEDDYSFEVNDEDYPSYEDSDESVEDDGDFYCEEIYGYFPHDTYCDKYWSCDNGTATLKECGNGLMFDGRNNRIESCNYDYIVPCGDRKRKGNSTQETDGFVCEDQDDSIASFGHYTRHPHPTDCRNFFVCVSGKPRALGCEKGQVFSAEHLVCKKARHVPGWYRGLLQEQQQGLRIRRGGFGFRRVVLFIRCLLERRPPFPTNSVAEPP